MYAVIFRARSAQPAGQYDEHYDAMVSRMRDLAFSRYGCRDFLSLSEGNEEVTISYWDDEESIRRWKNDPDHSFARQRGRDSWYDYYKVQVVEIRREYEFSR